MRRIGRFDACARRAGDGIHCHITGKQAAGCQRKQRELDTRGEAAWIGYMVRITECVAVYFRQAVYKIVIRRDQTEILCQIDDLDPRGNIVRLQKTRAFAVSGAKKQHVDDIERHLIGKEQVCFAIESGMYVGQRIAGVARRVREGNHCLRMV